VVYGTANGLSTSRLRKFTQDHPGMDGTDESYDNFGAALASGDFDNDGHADVVVGVPGENGGGGVQVILGSASGLTEVGNNLWTQNDTGVPDSDEQGDKLGFSLAVADFNGDGYDDIAAGAPNEDLDLGGGAIATDAGAVFLFFGAPEGISGGNSWMWTASTTLGTSESLDYWSNALAAGDFNADGYADLAVGAKGKRIGALDAAGEVTILPGYPDGVSSWGGQLWHQDIPGVPDANEGWDLFGAALTTGDFDGNGYADLAIGGPTESTGAYSANGAEWVLHGYLFADGLESGNTTKWQAWSPILRGPNNVAAVAAARLGTAASQYGLAVTLVDPSIKPSRAVHVMAGPNKGFANETRLTGSFFIDPQGLTMSTNPGVNTFQLVDLRDGAGAGSKTRLAIYLARAGGFWSIDALHWNDNLGPTGNFQQSGGAFLAPANDPNWRHNRVDFEWTAGNPGHLTMWRTRYLNGVPDANGRIQMLSVDLPGMQNAVINYVYAGMIGGQGAGTFGALYLDELSFSD
jgi:hypothetical protein